MDGNGARDEASVVELTGMLWKHYVFRRGTAVNDMWDRFYSDRPVRLLYIGGRGFDPRAQISMRAFVNSISASPAKVEQADLLLVGMSRYELGDDLVTATDENADQLKSVFSNLGDSSELVVDSKPEGEDELSTSNALRNGMSAILDRLPDRTDVVLDVSSMPRVVFLTILTGLLQRLVPGKAGSNQLKANGVNLQVLVAEDAQLDSAIRPENPSAELVTIPGFSTALHAESMRDWPMVWFPVLGGNRRGQLEVVLNAAIPEGAEICPVVPHPSLSLRRAEHLLIENREVLFDRLRVPFSNVLYVSEANPFEAYRQMLGAMSRYRKSLTILGGCRLAVTPLSSKLVTLGAGLACFETKLHGSDDYSVAMPYAEPMRYRVSQAALGRANPEIASLVLTGSAYSD